MYDADMKQSGAKINYHLLESNRVCVANQNESNFHIFYTLLLGSPNDLLGNVCLDAINSYKVNIKWKMVVDFSFFPLLFNFIIFAFSIYPIKIY